MIDVEEVNKYLAWKRDKELYPPRHSPEEYALHIISEDARKRLGLLYDYFLADRDEIPTEEQLNSIEDIIFKPLEDTHE